ncbi:hypothetical protein CABS02_13255 [Colletotrichum abscissum]|uniref:Uncharacterized protein n=1 Tax=Colletotrichum abscissum TaxID=1671311 RepID=A0A9P9X397_9PEZI|nr:hypothetical protein CABS02_13255 [Colletotrichum abscissum]
MSNPFSYLYGQDITPHSQGSVTSSDLMDFPNDTSATLTDGGTMYNGIDTPNTTDGSSLPEFAETPSAPEPTVLLHQIQQAAEDVSQLVGRFGGKMAGTAQRDRIKMALFADHKLLRLPCLNYADDFSCRVTKRYAKQPIYYEGSEPLLWWLWAELLDYCNPTGSTKGCELEFTASCRTDMTPSYMISLNLAHKNGHPSIEFTASYGGEFCERRIFIAPIATFHFPQTTRYDKPTEATLGIDKNTYHAEGCLAHTFDYLVPRPGSIWRYAMESLLPDEEEGLLIALAGTCKAEDDYVVVSNDQDKQCKNLLQRFPSDAREYITNNGLAGKKNGPYSKWANQPSGPKD